MKSLHCVEYQRLIPAERIVPIVRITFGGIVLVVHGVHKAVDAAAFFIRNKPWPLAEEIDEIDLVAPTVVAILATTAQLVAPALLIVGFRTRAASIVLAIVFAGAIVQNLSSGRDPQLAVMYLLIVLLLGAGGGGSWSLDNSLGRRSQ